MTQGLLPLDQLLPENHYRLRPFQQIGSERMRNRDRILLGDEPGLGKTAQALMALGQDDAVVVVPPAVAKGVWVKEARKWRPDLWPVALSGRGSFRWPEPGELVILNPELLPENPQNERRARYRLIGDEVHAFKAAKSQRTQRFRALARCVWYGGGSVWGLSGTPLLNHPLELWHVLYSLGLAQEAFGSWPNFCRLFHATQGRFGMVWGRPHEGVPRLLSRVMLRRLRKEVLPELPEKQYQDIPCEIDRKTRSLCDEAVSQLLESGIDLDAAVDQAVMTRASGAGFDRVSAARRALATAKIPAMLEIVRQYEDNEEPLLVFSAHRAPVDALDALPGWAVITGDTPHEQRSEIETMFQAGLLRGVGLTIQAGGVSLTLTHAAHALFVDQVWTPEINRQAEDRICRMGQSRGVLILRLVAEHRLDERVAEVLAEKDEIVSGSLYGRKAE